MEKLHPYYELAYALASGSLCFFVGTGFSKHLTAGRAPSWQELLEKCCDMFDDLGELKDELFPNGNPIMPLEECASVISLRMTKGGKSIYEEVAKQIRKLKADPELLKPVRDFSTAHRSLKFITTNYDRIILDEVLGGKYTGYCPGYPVNRNREFNEVYHIHGAVSQPEHMIVTADDYYRFMNFPNYYSKRLDTLLEENTTVIIGYSLGDINLKSILNARRYAQTHSVNRQHLFFLSRRSIPQHVKDYYDSSYGLRVIENTELPEFLEIIQKKYSSICADVSAARDELRKALSKKEKYPDSYLKTRESFAKILATISSTGFRVQSENVVGLLKEIIDKKRELTGEADAWDQYVHLAEWLVQLGSVMDLGGTALEEAYLKAVERSFSTMSKKLELGKSWNAYKVWAGEWGELTFKNRMLIRDHMKKAVVSSKDYLNFIAI